MAVDVQYPPSHISHNIMADIAISGALALLELISSFLDKEFNLRDDVRVDIDCITDWLQTMQAFLLDKEGEAWTQLVRDQVRQIREFAYDIEDIIDEFLFRVPNHNHQHRASQLAHDMYHYFEHRNALVDLVKKIQDIRKKVENFRAINQLLTRDTTTREPSSSRMRRADHFRHRNINDDEVVGFQKLAQQIRIQLLAEEERRFTVSIVGPAGSGKTVLARKVFEDTNVQDAFDFTSWVRVSTSFDLDELLCSIEQQLCGQVGNEGIPFHGTRVGIRERLKRHFKDRKYLIVLDDVWRKEDWELIIAGLPSGAKGSKVIITSCNREVASFCIHEPGYLHELSGLSWKDARNLFCSKAFRRNRGDCPPELDEWAQKIITKCERLPLAVSIVAGMLSSRPQIPVVWSRFHDSIGTDLSLIGSLLPSYNNLRDRSDLKSCFLYFGIFPEDYSIQRERLIRLWIAEGFMKKQRSKTLEEVAEDNLNELVHMNLVSVSRRDVDGRVRSCRVLNLVREFIISKAEEENFVRVLDVRSLPSSEKVRRISVLADSSALLLNENLNHARSVFLFSQAKFGSFGMLFKLLRVLELKGAALESFPREIIRLCLLRYLSLQNTKIREIPSSIKLLSLLETLDLKQTLVRQLPSTIFRLHNLRHLLIYRYVFNNYVTFDGVKGVKIDHGIGNLTSMQKLSLIKVDSDIIKELGSLVNLRKLGIIGLKKKDGKRLCESLQKMCNLSTLDVSSEREDVLLELENIPTKPEFQFLQRLYLKGRLERIPMWISSLQSLIKVQLKWSRMERSPLEALENLPNLMELEMVNSYTESSLEFKTGTFKKLKVLIIESFIELNMIIIQGGTMTELEKLKIQKCEKLSLLPLGIEDLSRLKELIVYDMNPEFLDALQHGDRSMVAHLDIVQAFDLQTNKSWSRRKAT